MAHYQEGLIRSAEQESRERGEKEDLLRPMGPQTGPSLKATKDPKTGKITIELDVNSAVQRALANNLDIRVVGFDPEISRQDMVAAAAVFDYVVFSGVTYTHSDVRTNSLLASKNSRDKSTALTAGIKNRTVTGADVSLTYKLTRSWTNTTFGRSATTYEPSVELALTQPLLRDAWPSVNRATLHLARVSRRISEEAFRQKVDETIVQVVSTYWQLLQARRELEIQRSLLETTVETHRRVKERVKLDATAVVVQQTKAAVETRNATLIRAEKTVRDVQDQMGRLLVDGQINILADCELIPTTPPMSDRWTLDQGDQLATALEKNPTLAQARLAIKSAGITYRVATNALLPKLNLTAATSLQGLDDSKSVGHDQIGDGKYHSYSIGLTFEFPLGNRDAKAGQRRARMGQLKAVTNLRNLAIQVGQQVKERIRQIETTHRELQAQRKAVAAAKVQLQALEDTERIRGRLTPEFLQLKLQAQETLAAVERAELQALVTYNTAKVTLSGVTGTVLDEYGINIRRTDAGNK